MTRPAAPSHASRRPSLAHTLGVAIGVALIGGLLIGLGLAVTLAVLNGFGIRDTLLLTVYLGGLYSAVNAVGLVGLSLLVALVGARASARLHWAAMVAFYVFLNGALRFNPVIQPASVTPHLSLVGAIDMVALLVVSGLVMVVILRRGGARVAAAVAAVAILAALWGWNASLETTLRRDLPKEVGFVLADIPEGPPPAPVGPPLSDARVVLLAFDGLSWEVLLPLMREGKLPNFRAFLDDAAYGYLGTLPFTYSPVIWESVATGQKPRQHGIGYHSHTYFPGLSAKVRHLPTTRLGNSVMGLRRLLIATEGFAPWQKIAANSTDARVARLWEIASEAGVHVGLFGWMNSAPAVPINGFIHGYGAIGPLQYPVDLFGDVPELPPSPGRPREGMEWMNQQVPLERALWKRFTLLAREYDAELLMYYTHFGDSSNHLNWRIETIGQDRFHRGMHHPRFEPGPAITAAHSVLDEILGDVMARVPEDATIMVVSDHGFDYRGYEHDNGPAGVVLVRGPGVRPGPFEGATVLDVTPTLLHVLGLPVAEDMKGEPMEIAAPGGPLDREPRHVASYGPAAVPVPEEASAEALEKHGEFLKALGYVD